MPFNKTSFRGTFCIKIKKNLELEMISKKMLTFVIKKR